MGKYVLLHCFLKKLYLVKSPMKSKLHQNGSRKDCAVLEDLILHAYSADYSLAF